MRGIKLILLCGVAFCSSCAGISLSDEVDELKTASGSFGDSLRTLHNALPDGPVAVTRANVEDSLVNGGRVTFSSQCDESVQRAYDAFEEEKASAADGGYRQVFFDRAYRQIHMASLCDLDNLEAPSLAQVAPLPENGGSIDGDAVAGVETLGAAARTLDGYVRSLADLASNNSGKAHDDARDAVFASASAFLSAVNVPLAGPVVGLIGQLVGSLEAARRNARIAEYLRTFDAMMPHIMERIGHAARMANIRLALNHSQAAGRLAESANLAINGPGTGRRARLPSVNERLVAYDFYAPRLAERNAVVDGLRRADPMAAARAFVAAHHALTLAYTSRRARFESLQTGLQGLADAARELHSAIRNLEE